jgi:hypothetical protein
MYSPSLQYSLAQTHIRELRRSRRTWSLPSITTDDRTAIRQRHRLQPSGRVLRAIHRLAGDTAPERRAFEGRP